MSDVINDSNGNTLTEEADMKARWVEYSSNLYKRQPRDKPSNVKTGIKEPAPLKSEVEWALTKIKDGKAPGIGCVYHLEIRFNTHNQNALANAFLELLRLSSISQYHKYESYVSRSEIYSASQKKTKPLKQRDAVTKCRGV